MKRIIAIITLMSLVIFSMANCLAETTSNPEIVSITIDIDKYDYEAAKELLAKINEVRQSGNGWYYNSDGSVYQTGVLDEIILDDSLTQAAMYRAAQCQVVTSHELPSSNDYVNTAIHSDVIMENIAWGQESVAQAFVSLMEEKRNYSGQGHRRSLLSTGAKYAGIGCTIVDGKYMWVIEFAYDKPTHAAITNMTENTATMDFDPSQLSEDNTFYYILTASSSAVSCEMGNSCSLPSISYKYMYIYDQNSKKRGEYELMHGIVNSPKWTIADGSVASINGNTVTGLKPGKTTATASAMWHTVSVAIEVTEEKPVQANLVLPAFLTVIESEAFEGLPEGTVVQIPATVTSIADNAFSAGTILMVEADSPWIAWAKERKIQTIVLNEYADQSPSPPVFTPRS